MYAGFNRGCWHMAALLVISAHGCTGSRAAGDSKDAGDVTVDEVGTDEDTDGCGASLSSFFDGTWEFRVDRAWDGTAGDVQFPTDALPEETYEPVSDGQVMEVVVSNVGAAIAIGAPPIKGSRISTTADRIEYDLLEGTFAGGRFVIWEVGGSLQAELLIFGSGVPIVSGDRGSLCPVR